MNKYTKNIILLLLINASMTFFSMEKGHISQTEEECKGSYFEEYEESKGEENFQENQGFQEDEESKEQEIIETNLFSLDEESFLILSKSLSFKQLQQNQKFPNKNKKKISSNVQSLIPTEISKPLVVAKKKTKAELKEEKNLEYQMAKLDEYKVKMLNEEEKTKIIISQLEDTLTYFNRYDKTNYADTTVRYFESKEKATVPSTVMKIDGIYYIDFNDNEDSKDFLVYTYKYIILENYKKNLLEYCRNEKELYKQQIILQENKKKEIKEKQDSIKKNRRQTINKKIKDLQQKIHIHDISVKIIEDIINNDHLIECLCKFFLQKHMQNTSFIEFIISDLLENFQYKFWIEYKKICSQKETIIEILNIVRKIFEYFNFQFKDNMIIHMLLNTLKAIDKNSLKEHNEIIKFKTIQNYSLKEDNEITKIFVIKKFNEDENVNDIEQKKEQSFKNIINYLKNFLNENFNFSEKIKIFSSKFLYSNELNSEMSMNFCVFLMNKVFSKDISIIKEQINDFTKYVIHMNEMKIDFNIINEIMTKINFQFTKISNIADDFNFELFDDNIFINLKNNLTFIIDNLRLIMNSLIRFNNKNTNDTYNDLFETIQNSIDVENKLYVSGLRGLILFFKKVLILIKNEKKDLKEKILLIQIHLNKESKKKPLTERLIILNDILNNYKNHKYEYFLCNKELPSQFDYILNIITEFKDNNKNITINNFNIILILAIVNTIYKKQKTITTENNEKNTTLDNAIIIFDFVKEIFYLCDSNRLNSKRIMEALKQRYEIHNQSLQSIEFS